VDCRIGLVPGTTPEQAMAGIEATVRAAAKGDGFLANNPPEIVWTGFQTDPYVLEPGSEAEAVLAAAHAAVHGGQLSERRTTAVNDTRYYGLYFDIPGLCYGPKGEGAHAFDERTSIEDLRKCTRTIATFIADWCGVRPRG
jgi:acetylornithine deacetylase